MKDKRRGKDADGSGRPRGVRKNIVGSESQGLLQSAAGTGFIGFSAFQASTADHDDALGVGKARTRNALGGANRTASGDVRRGRTKASTSAKSDAGASTHLTAQVLPPQYVGGNSNLAVVSKRLSKRDVTTKIKAMAELRTMCRSATTASSRPAQSTSAHEVGGASVRSKFENGSAVGEMPVSTEALGGLAPHWVFLYQRLMLEGDHRSREAANATLLCMVKANRKAFQPLMPSLVGPWWCSQADTAPEVAASAKGAFEAVFPENKRASVLRRCAGGVLEHIRSMSRQTPAMVENMLGCTEEEAIKRTERMTVSALKALCNFMDAVGAKTNTMLCQPSATIICRGDEGVSTHQAEIDQEVPTYHDVIDERLWKLLDDPRPAVRRAMFGVVSACCARAPRLLRPESAAASREGVEGLHDGREKEGSNGVDNSTRKVEKSSTVALPMLLTRMLTEADVHSHRDAWQALLLLLREFKDTWTAEKGAHVVLPTLLKRLRDWAFLPSSPMSYPCLLPLLDCLPLETLLAPPDRKSGPPFCVKLLETLWTTMHEGSVSHRSSSSHADPDTGAPAGAWLADIVTAHVECAAFLLLKLAPPAESSGGGTSEGHECVEGDHRSASKCISSATTALTEAWRSFVLDEMSTPLGSSLRDGLEAIGRGPAASNAFAQVLGQLHNGGAKGAGVMGSSSAAATVWTAILQECKNSVDRGSEAGISWMTGLLVQALESAQSSRNGVKVDDAGRELEGQQESVTSGGADSRLPRHIARRYQGGLFGVCRSLFEHAIPVLEHLRDACSAPGAVSAASPRNGLAVATMMAGIARSLGMGGIFDMATSDTQGVGDRLSAGEQTRSPTLPAQPQWSSSAANVVPAAEAATPARELLQRHAATRFYERVLVPGLIAAAGSLDATSSAAAVPAFRDLTKMFLLAERGRQQSDDFRLLVRRSTDDSGAFNIQTMALILHMAPPDASGVIPEVEEALLKACGLPIGECEVEAEGAEQPCVEPHPDLAAFIRSCMGVGNEAGTASSFVGGSTVSSIIDVALVANKIGCAEPPANEQSPSSPAKRSAPAHKISLAVLEGLLSSLATGTELPPTEERRPVHDGEGEEDALAEVRKRGMQLIQVAFSLCGEGQAAGQLWQKAGLPALLRVVCPPAGCVPTGVSPRVRQDLLEDFMSSALREAILTIEGRDPRGGDDVQLSGEWNEGRSARLALALVSVEASVTKMVTKMVEAERQLTRKDGVGTTSDSVEAAGNERAEPRPILWRLGITNTSVWRECRAEVMAELSQTRDMYECARACARSRWAYRWRVTAAIMARSPDPRSRLDMLMGCIDLRQAESAAGEMLTEILAAGIVLQAASTMIHSCHNGAVENTLAHSGHFDLPPGLLISSETVPSRQDTAGASELLRDFGVGLPTGRCYSSHAEGGRRAIAATAVRKVVFASPTRAPPAGGEDAVSSREDSPLARKAILAAEKSDVRGSLDDPFELLVPSELWRAAFQSSEPMAGRPKAAFVASSLSRDTPESADDGVNHMSPGHASELAETPTPTSTPSPTPPLAAESRASADRPHHDVLLTALAAAVRILGDEPPAKKRGDVFAWWISCIANVVNGLLKAVVGETFVIGFGIGDDAFRLMASRAGTLKPRVPSPAELVPGARTLYMPDGQAMTVVAVHVDSGGGDPYYTVRPVNGSDSPGSTGQERQTVLERLSLAPPAPVGEATSHGASQWTVRPCVATALSSILVGDLMAVEQKLFSSVDVMTDSEVLLLASTTAASIRWCGSTCVRAALLSAPLPGDNGPSAWESVGPQVMALRRRWASTALKASSTGLTSSDGASEQGSSAVVALSAAVLSSFFIATPLMPSDDDAMRRVPSRLKQLLVNDAELMKKERRAAPAGRQRRETTLACLTWMRDALENSCAVHVPPSAAGVQGSLFADTQADVQAALIALVILPNRAAAGPLEDQALVRACCALLAAEGIRVAYGHGATMSTEAKAALVAWALSKFLFAGAQIASGRNLPSSDGGQALVLHLEAARLLTAVAWDGRKGWGGDGAAILASGRLVAGPRERAEVWKHAQAPKVWRGLHAAMIGAIASPTLQLCAYEVLEAAACGWDCSPKTPLLSNANSSHQSDRAGSENSDAGDTGAGEEWTEESSIVTRLAALLGGWGRASTQGPADMSRQNDRETHDAAAASIERGMQDVSDLLDSTAVEEELREQQDDLELIARCFPEDLLLAVEALPATIEGLPQMSDEADEASRTRSEFVADGSEVQHDEDDLTAQDSSEEEDADEGADVLDAAYANTSLDMDAETPGRNNAPLLPGMSKSKSRRNRLRRRLSKQGASSEPRTSRGRRKVPAGPSLTAPFLTWLLWLEHCRWASEAESQARAAARAFVVRAGALAPVLDACFRVLKAFMGSGSRGSGAKSKLGPVYSVRVSRLDPTVRLDLSRLAYVVYFRTVQVFPALSRSWWADDCDRRLRVWVADFTKRHVSPALIQVEARIIASATERGLWDESGDMTVRASATSRQVVASYVKEECTLEACIQLPPEYPLRNVDVTCTKRMGVSESRWRQWVLQIVTLLSLQDGSVLDAVMLWKKNVDKEFEGVEPCVICYGILHPRDMALPQMSCKTCKNRFHATCLYKWFHTSHKSRCPICQQPWA